MKMKWIASLTIVAAGNGALNRVPGARLGFGFAWGRDFPVGAGNEESRPRRSAELVRRALRGPKQGRATLDAHFMRARHRS